MYLKIFTIAVTIFTISSCTFFSQKNTETIELKSDVLEKVADPFEDSLALDREYISKLGLQWQTPLGVESVYMKKRAEILSQYKEGNTETNLLRSVMYLSSLEGKYSTLQDVEKVLCVKPELCSAYFTDVVVKGKVVDQNGRNIRNASIEVLGTNFTTKTDNLGTYELTFRSFTPAVIRLKASKKPFMIDISRMTLADSVRAVNAVQSFEKNFVLSIPEQTVSIDTIEKTIVWDNTSLVSKGYLIQNPFTKYLIPFDSIRKNGEIYQWKVSVSLFEFDRESAWVLLNADVFDNNTHGYLSNEMITFGMPFIVLTGEFGEPLEILDDSPMKLYTTQRETSNGDSTSTFKSLYQFAYQASQTTSGYPIDYKWLRQNSSETVITPFWVFDQQRGSWDNVGVRFATPDPYAPYNIESIFYTQRSD